MLPKNIVKKNARGQLKAKSMLSQYYAERLFVLYEQRKCRPFPPPIPTRVQFSILFPSKPFVSLIINRRVNTSSQGNVDFLFSIVIINSAN